MLGRVLTVGLFCVAAAQLTACGGNNAGSCNATNECPSGEVCQNHACVKTCESNAQCPGGYSCQGGVCVSGSTGVPEISSVAGTSDLNCGDNGSCIGTAFYVSGNHLTNTSFNLADSAGRTYDMTVQDGASDTAVTLVPVLARRQADLFADNNYVLTAVNQSGSTTANVSLLQGEPGPDLTADQLIDRINTASPAKKIAASKLDVSGGGGGGGGLLYQETAASPTGFTQDEYRVTLSGSTTATAPSKDVDINILKDLCGDENGCEISLGATRFHGVATASGTQQEKDALAAYVSDAPRNGGTCRFFLDRATGSWTVSDDCVAIYGLYRSTGTNDAQGNPVYAYDRAYQRYEYSSTFGKKGSGASATFQGCSGTSAGSASGDVDGGPLIVLGYKGACYFAEAPADNTAKNGCFLGDNTANFSLVASTPDWDFAGAYPRPDPNATGNPRPWRPDDGARQCWLSVRD